MFAYIQCLITLVFTCPMATTLILANKRPEQPERTRVQLSIDVCLACKHGSKLNLRRLENAAVLPILSAFLSQNLRKTRDIRVVFSSRWEFCVMSTEIIIALVNTTDNLLSDGCNTSTCSGRRTITTDHTNNAIAMIVKINSVAVYGIQKIYSA